MKVKECMSRNVVSIGAQEPVSVAARLMSRYNLGFLPVQGENGRLCGVLTDRDVVLRCVAAGKPAEQMRVSEVMSAGVLSVEAGEDAAKAARLMSRAQLRRLPVTQNGKLTGMISVADFARRGNFGMKQRSAWKPFAARSCIWIKNARCVCSAHQNQYSTS